MAVFYKGNQSGQIPGILPGPPPAGDYYWWQGGALWGTLIDYWHYTGDMSYVQTTKDSLLFQTGPDNNYMHPNWTASLGNDDQAFWGMSSMLAAELVFPDPPADDTRQWLALTQAVFNTQAHPDRHDETCNGGLRWQIPPANNGYNYKNSASFSPSLPLALDLIRFIHAHAPSGKPAISNGCFVNLGARLARYTGNSTYYSWAFDTYSWLKSVHYIDAEYNVHDGGHVQNNCTDINRAQFSYNAGLLLQSAAFMYNYTADQPDNATMSGTEAAFWKAEVTSLLNATIRVFFPDGIAHEPACEDVGTCTSDMLSFKGFVARWMAMTTQLAPFTRDAIMPVLRTSAAAAVRTCSGGDSGRMCGFKWHSDTWDGTVFAGNQMNVLATLTSLLVGTGEATGAGGDGGAPVTNGTGGTSTGDVAGGYGEKPWERKVTPITTADRAGAGILTVLLIGTFTGGALWASI